MTENNTNAAAASWIEEIALVAGDSGEALRALPAQSPHAFLQSVVKRAAAFDTETQLRVATAAFEAMGPERVEAFAFGPTTKTRCSGARFAVRDAMIAVCDAAGAAKLGATADDAAAHADDLDARTAYDAAWEAMISDLKACS